jgi:hypothetical protein
MHMAEGSLVGTFSMPSDPKPVILQGRFFILFNKMFCYICYVSLIWSAIHIATAYSMYHY